MGNVLTDLGWNIDGNIVGNIGRFFDRIIVRNNDRIFIRNFDGKIFWIDQRKQICAG